MSSWQFRRLRLSFVRVHHFWLAVVKEQHTCSAAIETLLVCKHWIADLNVYLVKQLYGNKQNITFVSMTDDVYDTHAEIWKSRHSRRKHRLSWTQNVISSIVYIFLSYASRVVQFSTGKRLKRNWVHLGVSIQNTLHVTERKEMFYLTTHSPHF